MTPQEKAKQLVDKMKRALCNNDTFNAKQCALIAVDEMIKTAEIFDYCETMVKYYTEVKTEIETL
jgi:hypothetical protein